MTPEKEGPSGTGGSERRRLPRSYLIWLAGILASLVGNSLFYFALGWSASAYGGAVAGLVLTTITLPRVLLLLFGGAVGDRMSARRVLILGDATMLVLSVVLAATAFHLGTPPWLLIVAGTFVGIVDAFYLPASGSMPRRLVDKNQLAQALALRKVGGQLVALGGGPLGGILVGLAGLAGAALVNAVTFAVVLVVLITIRPQSDRTEVGSSRGLLEDAFDGVRVGFRDPLLRPALLLTGAAAGFLLPVLPLLVPLLARQEHWGVAVAGLILGSQSIGMVAVTLAVVRRGSLGRPGLLSTWGLITACVGVLGLAVAPSAAVAIGAGLVMGVGNGMFVSHITPLILAETPDTHLSRIQALLTLLQALALLVMNNVLGNIASHWSVTAAVVICALAGMGTGLLGLVSAPLRTARADSTDSA
ncbi:MULTISPECIES: MFS transporter [unclassified Solwaraspora]|uniref:MFS transporter n=1 Tax=unclassified Solwaraspora TaxID=2627926 RepID=UPI00259B4BCA|nr:MFS transporter [Solwaraspora sp. WMMA2056]WJK44184.1 MFS transporter [Solwaraspora sp. WMMA2056]